MSLGNLQREVRTRPYLKARYGTDRFIEVKGYQLHYVEVGDGQPVVLIPGSFNTYRSWNRLVPFFANRYRLLALDYLGIGFSDKPETGFEYTIQEQTNIIAEFVKKLELSQVTLIGGAYGGAIVFDFAARYPDMVTKVVSIEGGVVLPDKPAGEPLIFFLKYPLIGDLALQLGKTGILNKMVLKLVAGKWYARMTPQERQELLEQIECNSRTAARIPLYKLSLANKTTRNIEEEAKSIQAPILYLFGTKSDANRNFLTRNLQFLHDNLPDTWIVEMEGGMHDLAVQKPKEVADIILQFLQR
jgi:pimeloyl-ACP methyl ester carboxylesterase